MKLRFDERKAAQAAARLIAREGGRISHLKLMKLMYLAERRALLSWGRPITFDSYVSMPHGPVLSFTLDRINLPKDPGDDASYWQQVISERENHEIRLLTDDSPSDALSPAEEEVLDEVYREYGQMDQWQLRDFSHTLPEWRDPKGSSVKIRIREILMSEGVSEDEALDIERELSDESRFVAAFGE